MTAFLLLSLFIAAPTAYAIEFDIWHTGMSLSEIVVVAKKNDIPLVYKGLISGSKGFDPRRLNETFYKKSMFTYHTELLGKRCIVTLMTTDEEPKWLYEIEVSFAGAMGDKGFGSTLLEVLENKYGSSRRESINFLSHRVWHPDNKSKIQMLQMSLPKVNYIDLEIKKVAKTQRSYKYQDNKNGYSKKDASRF